MYKKFGLLLIPLFFTFFLNITLNFFKFEQNNEIYSIAKIYATPIEVHKNYQTINNAKNFLNYKDKIQTIFLAYINLASIAIKKLPDNNQKNIIADYDSSVINEIYSEKFIGKDIIVHSRDFK